METVNQPTQLPQQQQQPAAFQQAQKAGAGAPGLPPQPATASSLGPNLHDHDRNLRVWRLRVRIVTAVFIALSMILTIARGATSSRRSHRSCSYYSSRRYCADYRGETSYDYVSLPMLVVAMIWNIAEFITYCVNKRGAHPGVHVALDLVIFVCLLLGGIVAVARFIGPSNFALSIAAGAFELMACASHFALFVMGCVATHRRRMFMKSYLIEMHTRIAVAPQIVYAYPPPPQGMMPHPTVGHYGPQYHELEQRVPPAQSASSEPSAVSPVASSSVPSVQPAAPYTNTERYA